jgi:hypothetical protein
MRRPMSKGIDDEFVGHGRLGAHCPVVADRARRRAGELALARLSSERPKRCLSVT